MKFFKFYDRIVESFKDCKDHIIVSSTLVNCDQITCVKILDELPYFTVYFANEKFVEIDKIHLERFLEGIK